MSVATSETPNQLKDRKIILSSIRALDSPIFFIRFRARVACTVLEHKNSYLGVRYAHEFVFTAPGVQEGFQIPDRSGWLVALLTGRVILCLSESDEGYTALRKVVTLPGTMFSDNEPPSAPVPFRLYLIPVLLIAKVMSRCLQVRSSFFGNETFQTP